MPESANGWQAELLDFWFSLDPQQYWTVDAELDEALRKRFLKVWERERERPVENFLTGPDAALGAIILFDQLPRNMFRGHADSFSTDHIALAIAGRAIDRGYDSKVPAVRRGFFYLPFEHSEDREDQLRSLGLFTALGDPEMLRFAKLHRDIIERFGRFPHRNAILGREPRADEKAAADLVPW